MGKVRNVLFIMSDQLRWTTSHAMATRRSKRRTWIGWPKWGCGSTAPMCNRPSAARHACPSIPGVRPSATVPPEQHAAADRRDDPWRLPPSRRCSRRSCGQDPHAPRRCRHGTVGADARDGDRLLVAEGGFEPFERDDGLHPNQITPPEYSYNVWLRSKGYDSDNPWNDFANAAEGPNGEILSGWSLRNSNLPARVKEEHSETPYITDRGLDFIRETGEDPWLLHLSYIKPHWPYMAPAPYHDMYGPNAFLPVVRDERERADPHPVYAAFMNLPASEVFSAR